MRFAYSLLTVFALSVAPAQAEEVTQTSSAALVQEAMASLPAAQSFGRLFTSVQERRVLDNLRRNIQPLTEDTPAPLPSVPIETVLEVPTEVQFSGFVLRADGRYAVWIDGKSSLSKRQLPIDSAQFDEQTPYATFQSNQQQATMKPGQIWSLDSNTIREGYYLDRVIQQSP